MRSATPALRAVRAALVLLLAVVVFANGWGVFHTDIKPEIYLAPGRMIERYLSAWTSTPYLGSPNFNVGVTPVVVVLAGLRTVLDPEITFKTFHLLLWLLAASGAGRLLRALAPAAGPWAALAAGVAYLVNPYAVSAGATLAVALPFALLPWLLLSLVRALENPRSWRHPAVFGLVFLGMSGMNVAVVPLFQLLLVPVVAAVVGRDRGLTWRRITAVLARCALFVVGVSLYWLVPGVAAARTGSQIVSASETIDGIGKVSSLVEVLRGMGLWALYGQGPDGPWVPEHAVYLTSPVVIVLTLLWPVLAIAGLAVAPRVLRRVSALGLALAAVVMVGVFPQGGSSPFGAALAWLFTEVPVLGAFRTTNKIGSVLTLCLALPLGLAASRMLPRLARRPGTGPVALALTAALAITWCVPAVTGRFYISPMPVPSYWEQAASSVDRGDPLSRVLLLPGTVRPHYRWSPERPDDLPNALMDREAILPETTPNTSAWGANLLAALDDAVQTGRADDGVISLFARVLGAGDVLVRHDLVWEQQGGARPATLDRQLSTDPGLAGQANFGRPGQNLRAAGVEPVGGEGLLPPVQQYGVLDATRTVRVAPTTGSTVIAGDGWTLAALQRLGLVTGTPTFRYAADLDAAGLTRAVTAGGRMVLGDGNRRAEVIANRLTAGQGALLGAEDPVRTTRALGGPTDQTVLEREGARVRASETGGAFFDLPYGAAENVFDGDPTTSWIFGDFSRGVGQWVEITLPKPVDLGRITLEQTPIGSQRIGSVRVDAAGSAHPLDLPDEGPATLDLTGVRTDRVRVTVTGLRGDGFNALGLREITLGGADPAPRAVRVGRLPLTLAERYTALDAAGRADFSRAPLDVVFSRVLNAAGRSDDTETTLERRFTLPDPRRYTATALVRIAGDDLVVRDRLAGFDPAVRSTASGTFFDRPENRPSMAADDRADTGWVPGGDLVGAWWQVEGPRRAVPEVALTQRRGQVASTGGSGRTLTEVAVEVDGTRLAEARVGLGTTRIPLPAGTVGRTVRVVVLAADGVAAAAPPLIARIDAGVTLRSPVDPPCLAVATLDGEPVRMRPADPTAVAGAADRGTRWTGCAPITLGAGEHRLSGAADLAVDDLALVDSLAGTATRATAPAAAGAVEAVSGRVTDQTLRVRTTAPAVLSIGQGFDPRWTASLDGRDLGGPSVVDGFSTGWLLPSGVDGTVRVRFTPQRWSDAALAASAAVALLALLLALRPLLARMPSLLPGRLRRRRGPARAGGRPDGRPAALVPAASGAVVARPLLPSPLHRPWVTSGLLVLLAGVALGRGGLAGALVAVAARHSPRGLREGILGGVLLILLGGLVQVAITRDVWGTVSADAVHRSLWPHSLIAAGLVLALTAALVRHPSPKDPS